MSKREAFSALIVLSFVVVSIFLLARGEVPEIKKDSEIKSVTLGGKNINVELAISREDQEKGLSGREKLSEEEGMLFIFDRPGKNYFWMKDMHFPIDIIWLSQDQHVIYIKKNAKPEDYPNAFGPDENSKYVLEVSAGFSEKNNLMVGDSVKFNY